MKNLLILVGVGMSTLPGCNRASGQRCSVQGDLCASDLSYLIQEYYYDRGVQPDTFRDFNSPMVESMKDRCCGSVPAFKWKLTSKKGFIPNFYKLTVQATLNERNIRYDDDLLLFQPGKAWLVFRRFDGKTFRLDENPSNLAASLALAAVERNLDPPQATYRTEVEMQMLKDFATNVTASNIVVINKHLRKKWVFDRSRFSSRAGPKILDL